MSWVIMQSVSAGQSSYGPVLDVCSEGERIGSGLEWSST